MVMLVSGSTRFPWGAQMKKTLLAGVATGALAIAAPASAADLRMPVKAAPIAAPAPYFSWTGCYIGAHVGWGWGSKDFHNVPGTSSETSWANGNVKTSGAIFGGQLGCDYQLQNNFVIGVAGSVSGADINGFNTLAGISQGSSMHAKTDFLASITGRIGWTGWDPRVLFYFQGGGAWAHDRYLNHTGNFATSACSFQAFCALSASDSRSGWTIGGGVEWAFAPSWSAFAEYDHYDFGTNNVTVTGSSEFFNVDINQKIDSVRVGVNYKFNVGFLDIGKGKGVSARY